MAMPSVKTAKARLPRHRSATNVIGLVLRLHVPLTGKACDAIAKEIAVSLIRCGALAEPKKKG